MINVTADCSHNGRPPLDIWPYVDALPIAADFPKILDSNVESVYRSADEHFDHVLIPTGEPDIFLVVVVNLDNNSVFGHVIMDFAAEYGLRQ